MIDLLRGLLGLPHRADSGAREEAWARAWLERERRFVVVAANWRNPSDRREELDLVCRDGPVLVFVEVKARPPDALVPGYFAVDARKRRVLRRAAQAYLRALPASPQTFRFDIVEVVRVPAEPAPREIRHFECVPLFGKHFRG